MLVLKLIHVSKRRLWSLWSNVAKYLQNLLATNHEITGQSAETDQGALSITWVNINPSTDVGWIIHTFSDFNDERVEACNGIGNFICTILVKWLLIHA